MAKINYMGVKRCEGMPFRKPRWLMTVDCGRCVVIESFVTRPTQRQVRAAKKRSYKINRRYAWV